MIKDEKQRKMKAHLKELYQMQNKISKIAADKEADTITKTMNEELKKKEQS